jgi:serine protease AprX
MKFIRPTNLILMIFAVFAIAVIKYSDLAAQEVNAETPLQNAGGVQAQSYIVQGTSVPKLSALVKKTNGKLTDTFPIINAVSALLLPKQAAYLDGIDGITVQADRAVKTMSNSSTYAIDTYISTQIKANEVHDLGITGRGVTVAIVDSGANMGGENGQYLFKDSQGEQRVIVKYDAINGEESYYYNDDNNGHGSHVTGIIASSLQDASNDFNGVAPDVFLLSIKAFDANGDSSYSTILNALTWVSENRGKFNVKVLNLSLGAEVQSRYWKDPINQAVMHLWRRGITVITSAGNNGEELGITVPGNNPYVITVGSTSHNNSPYNLDDDRVASFSAQGPTYEGFVKPDVVAPGAQIEVKLEDRYFVKSLKKSRRNSDYSMISGTSQSAAVVSGIAALIIQAHPGIRPDDVKCKIMQSAKIARNKNKYSYSPLIQGSGMVNAYDAVNSNALGCANQGLNIRKDIEGKQHFQGPVNRHNKKWSVSLGNGTVMQQGTHWKNEHVSKKSAHWSEQMIEVEGSHWTNENLAMQGAHWSTELVDTKGSHWDSELMHTKGMSDNSEEKTHSQEPSSDSVIVFPSNTWQ